MSTIRANKLQNLSRSVTIELGDSMSAGIGYTPAGTGAVATNVQEKLREFVSVKDFGADAGDTGDQTAAIQSAIDDVNAAGGGTVYFPAGTYRVTSALTLYSDIKLVGAGKASALHLVNTGRSGLLKATGTQPSPLQRITIQDLRLFGDAKFSGGTPSVINGGGIDFQFTNDCVIDSLWVSGFSDGGIAFLNGSYNVVSNCRVRFTAQGISFNANAIDVYGNVMEGNICTDTGTHDGLHLEGSFGDDLGDGAVVGTAIVGNTVRTTRECGINIEIAPNTSCVGNTVINSGFHHTSVNMGIKLFGGFESTVVGNTIKDSDGYGIVVGANSGNSTISGNTTVSNTAGSILVTDSGIASTMNVTAGNNNLTEGDIATSGNVSFINRTRGFKFSNVAVADTTTIDWYEEGTFVPIVVGDGTAGSATYTEQNGRFQRIGNRVYFTISVGWSAHTGTGNIAPIQGLPYASANVRQPPLSIYNNGYTAASGTIQAFVGQALATVTVNQVTTTTGAAAALPLDTSCTDLRISGHYIV